MEFDLNAFNRQINSLLQPIIASGKLTEGEAEDLRETAKYVAQLGQRALAGEAVGDKAKLAWATVLSIAEKKQYELEKEFKALMLSAFETVATAGLKAVLAAL